MPGIGLIKQLIANAIAAGGGASLNADEIVLDIANKDVGIARDSAGILKVTDGATGNGIARAGRFEASSFRQKSGTSVLIDISGSSPSGIHLGSSQLLAFSSQATNPWGGVDLALRREAAGVLQITDGATGYGRLVVASGTAGAPGLSFSGDVARDTGFYLASDGNMKAVANGNDMIGIGFASVNFNGWPVPGAGMGAAHRSISTVIGPAQSSQLETNRGATGPTTTSISDSSILAGKKPHYFFMRIASFDFSVSPIGAGDAFRNPDGSITTAGKDKILASDGALLEIMWDGYYWTILRERGTINDEP